MRNWIILTFIFSLAVGCGCNRKEEKSKNKDNAQQKNIPVKGFEKNYDNSNSGLPREQLLEPTTPDRCLELGESGAQVGEQPIKELKRKCCEGLVDKVSLEVCGKGIGGGYIYSCIKCGDGTCDINYESKCNCPEDCKS